MFFFSYFAPKPSKRAWWNRFVRLRYTLRAFRASARHLLAVCYKNSLELTTEIRITEHTQRNNGMVGQCDLSMSWMSLRVELLPLIWCNFLVLFQWCDSVHTTAVHFVYALNFCRFETINDVISRYATRQLIAHDSNCLPSASSASFVRFHSLASEWAVIFIFSSVNLDKSLFWMIFEFFNMIFFN